MTSIVDPQPPGTYPLQLWMSLMMLATAPPPQMRFGPVVQVVRRRQEHQLAWRCGWRRLFREEVGVVTGFCSSGSAVSSTSEATTSSSAGKAGAADRGTIAELPTSTGGASRVAAAVTRRKGARRYRDGGRAHQWEEGGRCDAPTLVPSRRWGGAGGGC